MASSTLETGKYLLGDVFDRCLAMQAEHLAGLQAGLLAKAQQWLEERQVIVSQLGQALTEIKKFEFDDEYRDLLLKKLGRILSAEKVLFSLVSQQREIVSEKITVIRRGKRTLCLYSSTCKGQSPQFVSDKG
ncbi:MAG: hypothetical protein PHI06_11365 [Desulfobulbaceae bacterium]|nr:hypothetical protein [Desulfobulbaceae bacterium]